MVVKVNRKNKLQKAVLYYTSRIDDEFIYLYPSKILNGYVTEDNKSFYDIYDDSLYELTLGDKVEVVEDDYICFLLEIKKDFSFSKANEKQQAALLFEYLKQNILVLNTDTNESRILSEEEIERKFGINIDDNFVNSFLDIYDTLNELEANNKKNSDNTNESNNVLDNMPIRDLIKEVKKTIISQDDAVEEIITQIYKNYLFNDPNMKSNIFIVGPTGTGKTEIIKTIAKKIDVPVLVEDISRYTPSGYKGSDLDNLLMKLYENAGCDLKKAEKSILMLDEIDKKAKTDDEQGAFKQDVLKSLLKIVEGGVYDLELSPYTKINFDTSNLTVIVAGAFSDLYEKKTNKKDKTIGFSDQVSQPAKLDSKITIDDLVKYGMPVEFIGRFSSIVELNNLSEEDFVKILKQSDKSPLAKYCEALENKGIIIDIPNELYYKIASLAKTYNTGARALKIVVDKIFNNVLLDLFNKELNGNYKAINISEHEKTKKLYLEIEKSNKNI